MTADQQALAPEPARIGNRIRDRIASRIGVNETRKHDLYVELSQSATLVDASYWLQVLFSAGIATIGLVLNSPAVIIGAMLISPLMGDPLGRPLSRDRGCHPRNSQQRQDRLELRDRHRVRAPSRRAPSIQGSDRRDRRSNSPEHVGPRGCSVLRRDRLACDVP